MSPENPSHLRTPRSYLDPPDPALQRGGAFLERLDPWILERQMELSAIPAPPFGEGPRGKRMAELLAEAGLLSSGIDEEGNVAAWLPPAAEGDRVRPLVLSAHLDTVFPAGTEVQPHRSGEVIRGPGICDDARGLAALLGLARTLAEHPLTLPFPVLFAATVGEEGIGNLRGVRHLFREGGLARDARAFISLDGIGLDRVIVRGVGSTRLRIEIRGPGGHSWTDWGLPNPIHTLGRIVSRAQDLPAFSSPRTTLTVARWGGGRSINAIPQESWAEMDLRSEGAAALASLEERLLGVCRAEVESAGRAGNEDAHGLSLEVKALGRRPPGATETESPLVQAALEASRALGVEPQLAASSTDANFPMAMGIPAITLGAGGSGGGIHTLEEWYRNDRGPEGIFRVLLTLVLFARRSS